MKTDFNVINYEFDRYSKRIDFVYNGTMFHASLYQSTSGTKTVVMANDTLLYNDEQGGYNQHSNINNFTSEHDELVKVLADELGIFIR